MSGRNQLIAPRWGDRFVMPSGVVEERVQAWIDEVSRILNTQTSDGAEVKFSADAALALANSAIAMAMDAVSAAEFNSFEPSVQPLPDSEFIPCCSGIDRSNTFVPVEAPPSGATGTFTTADAKTVTVENGIITSIV